MLISEASQGTIRVPSTARVSVSKTVGQHFGLLRGGAERGVEGPDDTCDRHVQDPAAGRPFGGCSACRRLRLSDLGVVDVGSDASKLEAPDVGARDPVIHVVEERHEDRGIEEHVLELPVEVLPRGRAGLGAGLLQDPVGLRRGEVAAKTAVAGVKERECEVVGVVVVGDPAAEQEVDVSFWCQDSRNSGMVFVTASTSTPSSAQIRKSGPSAPHTGSAGSDERKLAVARAVVAPADRIISIAFSSRKVRLPPSWIVPEDPRRQQACGRQGEPAERSPDEILSAHGARECAPENGVRSGGASGVEQDEVGVLLGGLDETGAESGLSQNGFEVLREKVSRQIELSGPEAFRDLRRRERKPKLDPVEPRWLPPVAGIALENDPIGHLEDSLERARCQTSSASRPPPCQQRRCLFSGRSGGTGRWGAGREAGSRSRRAEGAAIPETRVGLSFQVLRDPEDRDEGRGHRLRDSRIERSSEALTAEAVRGAPFEKTTPGRR